MSYIYSVTWDVVPEQSWQKSLRLTSYTSQM